METAVIVALISSISSLLVAAATAFWSSRQNDKNRATQKHLADGQSDAQQKLEVLKDQLERNAKREERRLDAQEQLKAEMARYREPLLDAANDLGHRIHNIRNGKFLAYLDGDHPRRDTAVLSTLYRLARYFGTLEILYSRVNHLRFERDEATRTVAAVLAEIGRTFASDTYDREGPFYTARFMIWREEQRAMGELVRRDADGEELDQCVGFATFAVNASGRDRHWFESLIRDLESGRAESSDRLERLQALLAKLVRLLDEEGRYIAAGSRPSWMKMSSAPTLNRD